MWWRVAETRATDGSAIGFEEKKRSREEGGGSAVGSELLAHLLAY